MAHKDIIPKKTMKDSIFIPGRLKVFDETQDLCVLATNDKGQPYTSLVAFAITPDLKMVIFATPKETRKFKNILNIKKVSMLVDNRSGTRKNLMTTEAIMIMGEARNIVKGKTYKELVATFLKKHPDLKEFVQSDTTALIAVKAKRCIHVGKFQTISVWDCR